MLVYTRYIWRTWKRMRLEGFDELSKWILGSKRCLTLEIKKLQKWCVCEREKVTLGSVCESRVAGASFCCATIAVFSEERSHGAASKWYNVSVYSILDLEKQMYDLVHGFWIFRKFLHHFQTLSVTLNESNRGYKFTEVTLMPLWQNFGRKFDVWSYSPFFK